MLNFNCRTIPDIIAIVVCSHHGYLCSFWVPQTSHRHSQGSVFWKKKLLGFFLKKLFLLGPIPTQCLFVQHTKGNCTLFFKKAGGAADIVTLTESPSTAIQMGHRIFFPTCAELTSPPVSESFDEVFEAKMRPLCTHCICRFHQQ